MPLTAVSMVELTFACDNCGAPVAATLRCEGNLESLDEPPRVPLPCPTCSRVNDVAFGFEGEVWDVRARPRHLTSLIWN